MLIIGAKEDLSSPLNFTMRAILIKDGKGPSQNLYIGDVPSPSIGPGDVLVKIKAFGVNRMDISQREGNYPPPPGSSSILGVEFSGVVSAVAPDVARWKVGDEVLGLAGGGAYAEFISVKETHLIKRPAHLTWPQAASIPEAFLTAFQALIVIGQLQHGENVLIHAGASGVGVAAIQIARNVGANKVIATTSTQEKIEWLLGLSYGATDAVNYRTQDFAEVVKRLTGGKGADVVIDFVGQTHFQKNLEALAIDGRMTMLSLLSGAIVDSVNLSPLLYKRLHIEGSTLRSRPLDYQARLIARFEETIFSNISGEDGSGPIKTYIHKVYDLTEVQQAHDEMAANRNSGKIVVVIAE